MNTFAEVQKVRSLFCDLHCQWFVCGGWAIDLFLNRVTRRHKDIDIAIARNDQFKVRDYLWQRGWKLEKAIDGKLIPWIGNEPLVLPVHTIWCRKDKYDPNFVEVLLNEIEEDQFRFRRDRSITLARERMFFTTSCGLLVLAPEIVLLYKSNSPEEYDADFQNTAKSLAEESRVWLKVSLNRLFAQHPWVGRL
ncbi:MAG: hypothetical protein LC768_16195 [Acidobacteria bacterium]|nr:hypothetical protein [Acidobacteriota bacterium]MCA1639841.1 hypothetical protein [Acidobacteriota bacterium]